mmetsp:Transcript_32587/g.55495  ORF Transcript_32587/g.55495 Transcript_32587/m.55495 type:complete len:317 (-) Transcript_32587:58-1008(-)|eukprot:CAMPEP_0183754594 /NCGR_PEP_ID=MMETSP0739-20130205/3618_1 /TAXON_ID=385413 /ORGANISM="Thalassiosira miniscula, Strain CCMP1093" /LENGTH=316 /DNA_ID=CAMNT_0025991223 /DNA_START=124 /DNA_END=1074 /DNA_ORIENTATION=-
MSLNCTTLLQDVAVIDSLRVMVQKEKTKIYRSSDYFVVGDQVTDSDRKKMVDWCYNIVDNCHFDRGNVAMAMQMIDRLLSKPGFPVRDFLNDRTEYQLLVMAALYTAIKVNERVEFESGLIASIANGLYGAKDIETAELAILKGLGWRIYGPTSSQIAHHILLLILPKANLDKSTIGYILIETQFQTECAVRDYFLSTKLPSTVALAAILNALDQVDSGVCRDILFAFVTHNEYFERSLSDLLVARAGLAYIVEYLSFYEWSNDSNRTLDVGFVGDPSVPEMPSLANRRAEERFDDDITINNVSPCDVAFWPGYNR